jgi:hypothetical protein
MGHPSMKNVGALDGPVDAPGLKPPSERSFAMVFCVVFLLVALWLAWAGWRTAALIPAGAAMLLGMVAIVRAEALRPLNLLWFRFGLLLHHVISPVIMFLVFWVTVVPTALIRRGFGKAEVFPKAPDPTKDSYWVPRAPGEPPTRTMTRQF